jgi:ribosomal protein S27AE
MAHYAFLDDNSIVTEVIAGIDETELIEGLDPETWYANYREQTCVRTSYNSKIRYNYAGIGYTYDADADAFIAPRPECGHTELFLNHLYRWTCQRCELEAKELGIEA